VEDGIGWERASTGEIIKASYIFRKTYRKKSFGNRRMWKCNIKNYLKEIRYENAHCVHVAKDNDQRLTSGNTLV
jgi:hypothetical protein